jgi:hypothetical protein
MTLPSEQPFSQSDSIDSILFVVEGPGDTTRRPRRPSIPYTAPDGPLLPLKPMDPELIKGRPKDMAPPSPAQQDKPGEASPARSPEQSLSQFDSSDTCVIVIEGPMDMTRRPRRPGVPYTPPPGKDKPAAADDGKDKATPPEEPKDKPGDTPPAA